MFSPKSFSCEKRVFPGTYSNIAVKQIYSSVLWAISCPCKVYDYVN